MILRLAAAATLLVSATTASAKTELWVYTSIYKEFAATLERGFEKEHPDVDVQIFQAGSEKLQAKVEAELLAKSVQADILLTSDPFWAMDLDGRGLVWAAPGRKAVERDYYGLMVIVANKNVPPEKRPQSFEDLTKPELKGLVQLASPLESGTMFSAVAYLSRKYGWGYFEKLRANGVASAGGNSAVIQKVESGEKKFGIVLLENVLAAQKRGSPLEVIYPSDGAIPLPSVQVILKDAKHKDVAAQFGDFVLSEAGQKLLVAGYMYPVNAKVAGPEGARPLAEVTAKSTPWTDSIQQEVATSHKDIKKKFAALILE
jgi:iron(III) transport system substrate-binding protein